MKSPSDTFYDDLRAFRARYPMCYIEAWTPDDFEATAEDADQALPGGANWEDPKHKGTATILLDEFDAGQGTNWDRIQGAANAE